MCVAKLISQFCALCLHDSGNATAVSASKTPEEVSLGIPVHGPSSLAKQAGQAA